MKKTRRTKRPARPATVPIGHGSRFLFDVAAIAAARDMAAIRGAHVDPSKTPAPYNHPPRGGRLAAELAHLLTTRDIYTSEIREKAMSRATMLKHLYAVPLWYRFYPRDHVQSGGLPYDEEFVRMEYFGQMVVAPGTVLTMASGFAAFNPGSGVFSTVGYSMGTVADVRSGPIVTMEIGHRPVDIWLTANFLLDYQYQLSARLNPAFQAAKTADENISVKLDLYLDIDIKTLSGSPLSRAGALKPIKHAEIQPGSTLPPFIAGTKEIVPGNSLQGGELAIPVTFEHIFAAPANSRVRVGVTVGPFVTATGYSGSKDYRHLGNADGRAFGQVTSVEAILFP
jgi:hypothetical protein